MSSVSGRQPHGQPLLEPGWNHADGDEEANGDESLRQKQVRGSPDGSGGRGGVKPEKWSRCKGGCMWCCAVATVIFTGLALFLPIFAGIMFTEQLAEGIAFDSPDAQGYAGFVRGAGTRACLRASVA
jgi:hypothetical protein